MVSLSQKRKLFRALSLLTSAAMLSAACIYTAVPQTVAAAQTEQELQDQLQDLKEQQKQLQEDLDSEKDKQESYEGQIEIVEQQLETYQEQIDIVNDAIEQTEEKITDKEDDIEQTNEDIKKKEQEIEENDELFKDRLDAMYIADSSNTVLSMLLGAESFSDFLSATETVKSISESDQQLLEELNQQHQELETLKQQLEDDKQELEDAKQEQVEQRQELEDTKAEYEDKNEELQDLYEKSGLAISDLEDQLHANYDAIEETQENIEKLQEAAEEADEEWNQGQGGGGSSGGGSSGGGGSSTDTPSSSGYLWPLNGGHVSCHYGAYSGHRGIDLTTGVVGTSIYASRAGKVVDVQYWNGYSYSGMQSYGNMVRIYHPETGTYTRYAHCNSIAVSEGQWVSQGQVIAYMGNTGNVFPRPSSYNPNAGAHLHFEISTGASNSTRVNPWPYLS